MGANGQEGGLGSSYASDGGIVITGAQAWPEIADFCESGSSLPANGGSDISSSVHGAVAFPEVGFGADGQPVETRDGSGRNDQYELPPAKGASAGGGGGSGGDKRDLSRLTEKDFDRLLKAMSDLMNLPPVIDTACLGKGALSGPGNSRTDLARPGDTKFLGSKDDLWRPGRDSGASWFVLE